MNPGFTENIEHRYEQKFVFECKHPAYVEALVKNHPANFHEIFRLRHVNNIYFDKPGLSYFSDNYDGDNHRQKVRIRWYGDTFGQITNPVLEFKIKHGELGSKKTFRLPDFTLEKGFNMPEINKILAQANLPVGVSENMKGLEARLLNTYYRRYYRSFDHLFRFTIDHKLEYYEFSQQQNFFHHRVADLQNVILELKYDVEFASKASVISTKLPIRMCKFSKYVSGIEKLYSKLVY